MNTFRVLFQSIIILKFNSTNKKKLYKFKNNTIILSIRSYQKMFVKKKEIKEEVEKQNIFGVMQQTQIKE